MRAHIVSPSDREWSNFEAKPSSLGLRLAHLEYGLSVVSIKQDGQSAELRYSLMQEFQPLACKLVRLDRQSGGVAAWFRQTCDQTAADRIDCHRKYDGNNRRRLSYNGDGASDRENDIDVETDKFGCDLGIALWAAFRPAILDRDCAAVDPT